MRKQLAYRSIYEKLVEEIKKGKYPIDTLLPTEGELGEQYGASRTTIRKAVGLLVDGGYVEVKQGSGTRVLNFKTRQNFNSVTSVTESLRKKGICVTTKSSFIDVVEASHSVAHALQVKLGEQVARVQRVQLADQKPICIMVNYIPYSLVPEIEQAMGKFTGLYQYLEDQYGIQLTDTYDKIFAVGASFNEAGLLDVITGTPLLQIERTCYHDRQPVCFDVVKIIGSQYEVELRTHGRNKGENHA